MTAEHNNGNCTFYSQYIFQNTIQPTIFLSVFFYTLIQICLCTLSFSMYSMPGLSVSIPLSGGVGKLRSVGWKQPAKL